MYFKEWGEERFIEYLGKKFPSREGITGIGDDCAVIPQKDGNACLVTTDALVEGIHFLKEQIAPRDLGYKTVAVNVSDIAAMGGKPNYAFLAIALPKMTDTSWSDLFMDGLEEACDRWNILLLGGDTVGSKQDIFINLTLIGSASQDKIKYRGCAKAGDVICVTGHLGDSAGGLKALETKLEGLQDLIKAQFRPEPTPDQGLFLASHSEVHAMMDVSDGLNCDLKRLLKSSKKGAIIETSQLPISKTLTEAAKKHSWDALQLALVGGEDYCLLFTVDPKGFKVIQENFQQTFNSPLYAIGEINNDRDKITYQKNGIPIRIDYENFNHFH